MLPKWQRTQLSPGKKPSDAPGPDVPPCPQSFTKQTHSFPSPSPIAHQGPGALATQASKPHAQGSQGYDQLQDTDSQEQSTDA